MCLLICGAVHAGQKDIVQEYPPTLPDKKRIATDRFPEFLRPSANLLEGVTVATVSPTVDFMFLPGQDYAGKPWSVWGDGCAVNGMFYCAISDHHSPKGTAKVYEYDSAKHTLRELSDVRKTLETSGTLPDDMNYRPSKIHSSIGMGSDGWLYYSTHRGSATATHNQNGYKGDWILRTHPGNGISEIVVAQPMPKHCLPAGILDPQRMIFYAGTAEGKDAADKGIYLIAYDVVNKKLLKKELGGFERCAIFSIITGCLYWDGKKYDPATNAITTSNAPSVRSATQETADGIVYGTSAHSADIWAFNTKEDTLTQLGPGAVGKQGYTTSIEVDPSGRYLYYTPGAHGGAEGDGTPIVQFDVKARTRKVIAFLHPAYFEKYGYTFAGTFSTALDPQGEKLYAVWNGMRNGSKKWECCAMTVIHIPESERKP